MREQAFYQRIGSIMKDNMYDRTVVGFRSGKIANKTLYKTQIEGQTKIFSRSQERANKQYSISIMLDISGSMNDYMGDNSRLDVAVDIIESLIGGLERNNIEFSVIAYGSRSHIVKTFKQPMKQKQLRSKINGLSGGGTDETSGLAHAYEVISKQKGDRKNRFVMIFTDGEPNDNATTKIGLEKLDKVAKIFPFGIGLDISNLHKGAMRVCNKEVFMFKILKSLELNISRG